MRRSALLKLSMALVLVLGACTESEGGDDELADTQAESETSDEGGTDTDTDSDSDTTSAATETGASDTGGEASVELWGDAFAFGPGTMIPGATVTILELPEFSTTTDADGHFSFPALPAGAEASLRFEKDGNPVVHTKTFSLPQSGVVERVSFQVPDDATFAALAAIVGIEADPSTCQIASTVTRVGKSVYDEGAHGEAGATVTIDPPLPAEHGPVYFNDNVIPQLDLVETSTDGGVLYTNVPPGTYTLSAQKDGVEFEDVTVQCEADVLVNPSPPYGLQALP